MPWRDEQLELLENNNESTCSTHRESIERNRLQFKIFKEGELGEILLRNQEDNNEGDHIQQDNTVATQLLDDEFRALAVPEMDEIINILNINDGDQQIARFG